MKKIFPVSDDKYADELQLQEVIMSSVMSSLPVQPHITIRSSKSAINPKRNIQPVLNATANVAAKIQENITMVRCPDVNCKGLLEPESCQQILPAEVFDRWGDAPCESMILGSQTVYCPYKDCIAFLVGDEEEFVTQTECPSCRRLFCARCKVPLHSGVGCEEFQRLNKEEIGKYDLMVMDLAKRSKWKRCPRCKFYVEKIQGCLHITCRCGFQFCYGCGSTWSVTHASCPSM
ncbi:E3 ubiquitin-protein ligase RSL1-like [Tasmannia lanceolata]|uniref:E3 ubiquitin-protein ligase RSL1-like n=1 Tax=Tasmannia lanceolata TaxID=3420 RepID=UPI0040649B6F